MARTSKRKVQSVSFETVRQLALALPKVQEGTSYGTPAFRVKKTLFARLHQDGESLVVRIGPDERAMRMRVDPDAFFITDHYRDHPWMLVRMAAIGEDDLADVLTEAWRLSAPAQLVNEWDQS